MAKKKQRIAYNPELDKHLYFKSYNEGQDKTVEGQVMFTIYNKKRQYWQKTQGKLEPYFNSGNYE